jgi:hypothetical protein
MAKNETTATFGCRCGEVRGTVVRAAPGSVNRVVCYCDDCQAFAHWLGREDLLDAHGGSDIVQMAPAATRFTKGEDRIAGVRLSAKGLHRYYATCCNTPVGNMVGPAIPFVGVVVAAFRADGQDPDAVFGRPIGAIKGEYAVGAPPPGSRGMPLGLMARAIAKVLTWRLSGQTWPHPFFDRATGKSRFAMTIIPPAERERLRTI